MALVLWLPFECYCYYCGYDLNLIPCSLELQRSPQKFLKGEGSMGVVFSCHHNEQ